MARSTAIATLHAYSVFALAIAFSLRKGTREQAIYLLCYVGCCDVLWRMNRASFPWEGGKYLMILIALLLWSKTKALSTRSRAGLLMSALLLPSCLKTVGYYGFTEDARQAISFNLSGVVAITGAVVLFSSVESNRISVDSILRATLAPIVAIFGDAAGGTLAATSIKFSNGANFTTSGGYGPNQVSSLLGLGALLSLILMMRNDRLLHRGLWLGMTAAMVLQSVLTFSRGGLFNILLCSSVLGIHYLSNRRARGAFLAVLLAIAALGWLAVPNLDQATNGAFSDRFTSTNTTGRAELGRAEIELWMENPVFGAGPGMATITRRGHFGVASHTEFTRLLSEHGLLGLAVILLMLFIATSAYITAPSLMTKAWVATFTVWSLSSMLHTGMRFSAAALVFGFATLEWRRWSPNRRVPS